LSRKTKNQTLYQDSRVQHFIGRFLNGQISEITPVLDPEKGYRYPQVEELAGKETDIFLAALADEGILEPKLSGVIVCCSNCGSFNMDKKNKGKLVCKACGAETGKNSLTLKHIYSYTFSEKGIQGASDMLLVKPLYDFLQERGYKTTIPGMLIGDSDVEHRFDLLAHSESKEDGVIALDFSISNRPIGEKSIVAMFAKVYDTNPQISVFVAVPSLTEDARKLATQYSIDIVETGGADELWMELRRVIPPVDEFGFEALDVMTLLALPDHLRKTATVTSKLGRATADEISENTDRARAVESGYLNQLVRMGYLKKEREGRRVLFSVTS
jgi:hypothetical protein